MHDMEDSAGSLCITVNPPISEYIQAVHYFTLSVTIDRSRRRRGILVLVVSVLN
jgi:hypothetical protein